jgi:hypothetical protein
MAVNILPHSADLSDATLTAVVIVQSWVGQDVTRQPDLHSAIAELLELDVEPVHFHGSRVVRVVSAPIDNWARSVTSTCGSAEVSTHSSWTRTSRAC